ncbi:peroxisomal testis-specific protein 1 [Mustela lutreola]|uniref:peroxisomal testis-specific protein 1 n=1 Tax=Mustela lutreola TaxID=9666 RepID=UPI0027973368|nr:peroxisomal testis-specific protein 1 [Mustela lutreola]
MPPFQLLKGKNMKKKHDTIVCEPKELLNASPKVTNCCKSLWVKYSFQEYMMDLSAPSQFQPCQGTQVTICLFSPRRVAVARTITRRR